jgi:4-hydroxyphenylpyruvate dioxygenase
VHVLLWSHVEKDEHGEVVRSGIYTYGETVHIFLERKKTIMVFSYQDIKNGNQIIIQATGLKYIDHMVGNVGWNEMNTWVKFYEEVRICKFLSFDDKQITTEYSAMSKMCQTEWQNQIPY